MNSIRKILVWASVLLMVGCVHVDQKTLPKESVATLSGKRVDYTQYEKPSFSAMTAGKALFGAIGAMAMISAGNDIVKTNGVEDPSISISQKLIDQLVGQHGMQRAEHQPAFAADDDVMALSSSRADVDYLLDVKTINWSFSYFPSNWARYRVFYSTRMRLIDIAQHEVIASTMCGANPVVEASAPSKDDLLADNAKVLKSYLQKAADDCTAILSKDFLQL